MAKPLRPDPEPTSSGAAGASFFAIFPSVVLPVFLAIVDQTIVATALPGIAGDLGHVESVAWVVIAYLIAVTISSPVYGRLGDMLGRRRLMFVALGLGICGTAAAAMAPSFEFLLAARVLQGLGGGGLMTLTQALVGEAVPPRERAKYQGYLATVALTSNAFGPVVGGLLTEHFGWRAVFVVNSPLWALAIMLVLRLPHRKGSGEKFSFDFAGLLLYAGFTIGVLLGLQYVQKLDSASLGTALALLLAAIVFLVLLVLRERSAAAPLFPPVVVRNPSIWRSDGLAACHGAILVSMITFSPIYFHVVHSVSIAQTGLLLLPMTVALATGSMTTGRIVSRTGYTAVFPSWGMLVVTLALLFLALSAPLLNALQASALLGLTALFMGSVMGVVQVTVQVSAGPSMLGTAAATVQLSRSLGASFGTAAVGAVLFISMRMMDPQAADIMLAALQRGGSATAASPVVAEAGAVIADAFRLGFATMAIFAALSSILAWSMPLRRI